MEEREIFEKAVSRYGAEAQIDQLVEECAELIVAISHYRRGRTRIDNLLSEIADVEIMVEQMKIIFGYDQLAMHKNDKLIRLERRMS